MPITNAIISPQSTQIEREEVLSWFDNKKNFIEFHQSSADDIFAEKFKLQ